MAGFEVTTEGQLKESVCLNAAQAVIDYQGDARDFLNTLNEYARVSEQYRLKQADEKLLKHMFTLGKKTALEMVLKTDKVGELLKERAKSSTLHENGRHRAP